MSIWSKVFIGLNFVAFIALTIFTAGVLKIHSGWRTGVNNAEKLIEQKEAAIVKQIEGDAGNNMPSMRQLQINITQVTSGRGPIWRKAVPAPADATGKVTVTVTVVDPGGASVDEMGNPIADAQGVPVQPPNNNPPADPRLAQYKYYYAFDNSDLTAGGEYVGRFRNVGVQGSVVTLEPAGPQHPRQLQKIAAMSQAGHTWTLLAVMPKDSHEIFAETPQADLPKFLPAAPAVAEPQKNPGESDRDFAIRQRVYEWVKEDYAASHAEFMRDGQLAQETDPPENKAIRVRFAKQVDANAAKATLEAVGLPADLVNLLNSGYIREFPFDIAERLVADGLVEEVPQGRVYRRTLRDYEFVFREFENNYALLLDANEAQAKNLEYMTRSVADAREHQKFAEAKRAALTAEKTRLTDEAKLAMDRQKEIDAELAKVKAAVNKLIKDNQTLANRLADLQRKAAQQIEERVTKRLSDEVGQARTAKVQPVAEDVTE